MRVWALKKWQEEQKWGNGCEVLWGKTARVWWTEDYGGIEIKRKGESGMDLFSLADLGETAAQNKEGSPNGGTI